LELQGGRVVGERPLPTQPLHFTLPPTTSGYADAQLDDYGAAPHGRWPWQRHYPWQSGVRLTVEACFSHEAHQLQGTAGFGFWNAPFGDPTMPWPSLPQAAWFFFASPPNDLFFAPEPGRGWFAGTLNAAAGRSKLLLPLAPLGVLLMQVTAVRRRLWPVWQRQMGLAHQPIAAKMTEWHTYQLDWREDGCMFAVDGQPILHTPFAPRGPLGFVCWIDNQYLVATPNGRLRWGTLPTSQTQWMDVRQLTIESALPPGEVK
jgi:hypothetical protein